MKHKVVITEKNGEKRNIGYYDDEKNEFVTLRDNGKHLLRKYNAWAIDKKLLEELLAPKNTTIIIKDTKNRKAYKINAKEFLEKGREVDFHQHRKQIYLNINSFEVTKY
ncbi:MAG: hypothetical protein H0Z24_05835 [Thermosipho sp. (in: Bacteria)]|nr:hypothetical protein [Thermosipho sp. (in: thermotogales)]